jgi:hypothetical protein
MKVPAHLMDFNEIVDLALKIAAELGFTLAERGRLFGVQGSVGDNPDYLARELKELSHDRFDVEKRCNLVFGVNDSLEACYPNDLRQQKSWLEKSQEALAGKSCKALMSSGGLADLEQAARFLEKCTA